jgi:hypothetical protein
MTMAKPVKRPTYYTAICLRDGTIICALPTRKPIRRILKRDKKSIDVDNIIESWRTSGIEYRTTEMEQRVRVMDIMTNSLNTRRNLRDLVLPTLDAIETRLSRIEATLERMSRSR